MLLNLHKTSSLFMPQFYINRTIPVIFPSYIFPLISLVPFTSNQRLDKEKLLEGGEKQGETKLN